MADDYSPKAKILKLDDSSTSTASASMSTTSTASMSTTSTANMSTTSTSSIKTSTTPTTPMCTKSMDTETSEFSAVLKFPGFVDKTLLIKAVFSTAPSCILVVAPRRFGKSVNMNMLKRFVEKRPDVKQMNENRQLFDGCKISAEESIVNEHQGKWPVIFFNLKNPENACSYNETLAQLADTVHHAYKEHYYLLTEKNELNASQKEVIKKWCNDAKYRSSAKLPQDIYAALEHLAEYLKIHHKHDVFVLADDYNSICLDAAFEIDNEKERADVIGLCTGALSCLLKDNENVGHGFLTGISSIMTMGRNKLNNVISFEFQYRHAFSEFYGLKEEGLKIVLQTLNRSSEFEEIVEYYNGYKENGMSIWSIMQYLNTREIKTYWTDSGIADSLISGLKIAEVRTIITRLLGNSREEFEIEVLNKMDSNDLANLRKIVKNEQLDEHEADVYLNFLLERGYFRIDKFEDEANETGRIVIKIPNQEILTEFRQNIIKLAKSNYKLDMILVRNCAKLFDDICESTPANEKLFEEILLLLNKVIKEAELPAKNEATFHHLLFIILLHCSKYQCFSEVRSSVVGRQCLDLLLIRKDYSIGIILELKYQKTAEEALKQIFENRYWDAFHHPDYNPTKTPVNYCILIGAAMNQQQDVDISVLYNPDLKQTSPKKGDHSRG